MRSARSCAAARGRCPRSGRPRSRSATFRTSPRTCGSRRQPRGTAADSARQGSVMITRREALTGALCGLALAADVFSARAAEATGSSLDTITTLQAALVDTARRLGKGPVAERYRALEPTIVKTHNLPYIAEFALRRQWAMLTDDERRRF